MLNRAIGQWLGASFVAASDLTLELTVPLDCMGLPANTDGLLQAARSLHRNADKQTLFQQQLPIRLQEREWSEAWINDAEVPKVLERLRRATIVNVSGNAFSFMDADN